MELNLNDLSLISNAPLSKNWACVEVYFQLVKSLIDLNVDKILVNGSWKTTRIGDFPLDLLFTLSRDSSDYPLSNSQAGFLLILFKKYHKFVDIQTKEQFLVDGTHSAPLADSFCKSLPVLSITLDDRFNTSVINGIYKESSASRREKKASVLNLFKEEKGNIKRLPDFREIAQVNAEDNPLWNQVLVSKYLSSIKHENHRPSVAFLTPEEKYAYLIEHGTVIANLCGWEESPGISRKNTTDTIKRVVFYSAAFRRDNVYLCIDLEHQDFHFELCDKRGKHLGEYRWDGTKTSPPDSSHDIMI